jgi:CRP/FNR family transcriptional regulator, cyclic AMP receptor protein
VATTTAWFEDLDGAGFGRPDRRWHLERTGLTEGLTPEDIRRLIESAKDLIVPANHVIFRPGERAGGFFWINRGSVRLTVLNENGREGILRILGAGEFFGEDVFCPDGERQLSAVAHEESWVSTIQRADLLRLIRTAPALGLNLIALLNARLGETREELRTLTMANTERRLARTLLKLLSTHGRTVANEDRVQRLRITVSHELISRLVGANRPHVSAILSRFKKKGLIRYDRRRLLIDKDRLAEVLKGANGRWAKAER